MKNRIYTVIVGASTAPVLAIVSIAWACSLDGADMVLSNATSVSWDSGDCDPNSNPGGGKGCNWNDCPTGRILYTNGQTMFATGGCTRPVDVNGSGFENAFPATGGNTAIDKVNLYWLDEPFFAGGAGSPGGPGEQATARICQTKGVLLQSNVAVNGSGAFSAQVNVPPLDTVHADNSPRPVKAYLGGNAICAVWLHDLDGDGTQDSNEHYSGIGNQYNIFNV